MFKKIFNSIRGDDRGKENPLEEILNSPEMQNRMNYQIAFDHITDDFYNKTDDFIYGVKTKSFTYGSWEKVQLRDSRTAFVVTFNQFDKTYKKTLGDREISSPRAFYAAAILNNENSPHEYFVLVEGSGRNYIRVVDKSLSSFSTMGMDDPRFQGYDTTSIDTCEDFLDKISF
jgi:hypothetical protein